MDVSESSLPDTIHLNSFPAKLWRLVNNPANTAIYWDSHGLVVIINQQLFETEVLSPKSNSEDNDETFKTTNFSSFIRQMNLYGFRKVDPHIVYIDGAGDRVMFHHFYHPNFKQNHPELVATLRRLTVHNKAKIRAGEQVNCRPPKRQQQPSGDGNNMQKDESHLSAGSSSPYSSMHQESPHPYYPNRPQPIKAHVATPIPPRYLMRNHGAPLSTALFASHKDMPGPFTRCHPGVASTSNTLPRLAPANLERPHYSSINPWNAQYQPYYYPPFCCYYHPHLMPSHMSGGYYQAGYSLIELSHGAQNQYFKSNANQEEKKCDFDTFFQFANEVMQTPLNSPIKVEPPERPEPVLQSTSSTGNADGLWPGSIEEAASGDAPIVTYEHQESVASVPEQMPADAICEVTHEDADDTVVIEVELSDIVDGSEDQSCTENTP